jgi:hypothetical protein
MYIMGQERRLVDPPSQVVAGVRTVTTNMNGRDTLPRCRAHSLFRTKPDAAEASSGFVSCYNYQPFLMLPRALVFKLYYLKESES